MYLGDSVSEKNRVIINVTKQFRSHLRKHSALYGRTLVWNTVAHYRHSEHFKTNFPFFIPSAILFIAYLLPLPTFTSLPHRISFGSVRALIFTRGIPLQSVGVGISFYFHFFCIDNNSIRNTVNTTTRYIRKHILQIWYVSSVNKKQGY